MVRCSSDFHFRNADHGRIQSAYSVGRAFGFGLIFDLGVEDHLVAIMEPYFQEPLSVALVMLLALGVTADELNPTLTHANLITAIGHDAKSVGPSLTQEHGTDALFLHAELDVTPGTGASDTVIVVRS